MLYTDSEKSFKCIAKYVAILLIFTLSLTLSSTISLQLFINKEIIGERERGRGYQ